LELYNAWGYRMDATPLQYFKTPKEMGATISSAPLFLLLLIFIFLVALFFFSLFLIAVLFIPIRGGIQKIPMNISDVYFSEKIFADHAAINLPWNMMF